MRKSFQRVIFPVNFGNANLASIDGDRSTTGNTLDKLHCLQNFVIK